MVNFSGRGEEEVEEEEEGEERWWGRDGKQEVFGFNEDNTAVSIIKSHIIKGGRNSSVWLRERLSENTRAHAHTRRIVKLTKDTDTLIF